MARFGPEAYKGHCSVRDTRGDGRRLPRRRAGHPRLLQVRHQLDAGTAVLVSDADTESGTMQPTNALPDHGC